MFFFSYFSLLILEQIDSIQTTLERNQCLINFKLFRVYIYDHVFFHLTQNTGNHSNLNDLLCGTLITDSLLLNVSLKTQRMLIVCALRWYKIGIISFTDG